MPGVNDEVQTLVEQGAYLLVIRRRGGSAVLAIRVKAFLNFPMITESSSELLKQAAAIDPSAYGNKTCARLPGGLAGQNALLINNCFSDDSRNLFRGADGPTTHGNLGTIINLIIVNGIALNFLAAHFAKVAGVEIVLAGVPI